MLRIEQTPEGGFLYEGCHYETLEDVLSIGVLGFCGCGMPGSALDLVKAIMQTRAFPKLDITNLDVKACIELVKARPEAATYIIFYLLTEKNLLEHGSFVPGWLTHKGERFLALLEDDMASPE